jgi:hypothetical protein
MIAKFLILSGGKWSISKFSCRGPHHQEVIDRLKAWFRKQWGTAEKRCA